MHDCCTSIVLFLHRPLCIGQGCPSPTPMFIGPPTVQPGAVRVSWSAAGSSDPLVTGIRYALYSQCEVETTFQLIDDDITGLFYIITTLPSQAQCVLRVVVYSDHCLLDVNGASADTTNPFSTGGKLWIMQTCPCLYQSQNIYINYNCDSHT